MTSPWTPSIGDRVRPTWQKPNDILYRRTGIVTGVKMHKGDPRYTVEMEPPVEWARIEAHACDLEPVQDE